MNPTSANGKLAALLSLRPKTIQRYGGAERIWNMSPDARVIMLGHLVDREILRNLTAKEMGR